MELKWNYWKKWN